MAILDSGIVSSLHNWYLKNKRDLPWRLSRDPYFIWISEIMLQQTRVKTVIPYYKKFITAFPDIVTLAQASDEEIRKHWEGLGYYRRAANMHKTAKKIVSKWGGNFPTDYSDLLSLPGIGVYTASAICSIAYNQPYIAIDGNVLRITARVCAIRHNILDKRTEKRIATILADLRIDFSYGDFNQSLMELGSLVCVPKNPFCNKCPITNFCVSQKNKLQNILPIRKNNTKKKRLKQYLFIISYQNKIMIRKRPEKGILADFWEFPCLPVQNLEMCKQTICEQYKIEIKKTTFLFRYQHIFSHRVWNIRVYYISLDEISSNLKSQFFTIESINKMAMPAVFSRIRNYLISEKSIIGEHKSVQ